MGLIWGKAPLPEQDGKGELDEIGKSYEIDEVDKVDAFDETNEVDQADDANGVDQTSKLGLETYDIYVVADVITYRVVVRGVTTIREVLR